MAPLQQLTIAALVLSVHTTAPRSRQEPQPPPRVFSASSELVVLHASVLDRKAGFVAGLPREAFAVFENGQPQTITFFTNEDSPVTVGLVIDCSGSMQRKRAAVISAGLAFARSSHPQDEMFTVNFNERVWPGLPFSVPFTSDIDQLNAALQRSATIGQTALFDGVNAALAHLKKGTQQKKILIVVSDGADNASKAKFTDVLDAALRADAVIYTIGLHDEYDTDAKPGLLRKLAEATGAESFFPHDADDTTRILERVSRDIRSGYTIGYVPTTTADDGAFRAIRVTVDPPGHHKLKVRARSGYVAEHHARAGARDDR